MELIYFCSFHHAIKSNTWSAVEHACHLCYRDSDSLHDYCLKHQRDQKCHHFSLIEKNFLRYILIGGGGGGLWGHVQVKPVLKGMQAWPNCKWPIHSKWLMCLINDIRCTCHGSKWLVCPINDRWRTCHRPGKRLLIKMADKS